MPGLRALESPQLQWQASIAAASGDLDGAVELLRQALNRGAFSVELHRQPLWLPLHGNPAFIQLLRPKG